MNLIICSTPLQVLIAEKIIDLHPSEEFYGVMIAAVDNEKYKHYGQRLKSKCKKFSYITNISVPFKKVFFLFQFYFLSKSFCINKFFVASVDAFYAHALVSFFKQESIYTFDDGSANITKGSLYYKEYSIGWVTKILFRVFQIKENLNSLKQKSKLHYTIYENFENIVPNTFFVDIFQHKITNIQNEKPIRILLGQMFYKDDVKNVQFTEKTIKYFNIDYYLPHPRENYKVNGVNYINTPLIFEDYFMENLLNKHCELYSFFSTVLLNLPKMENVKLFAIKPIDITNLCTNKNVVNEVYGLLSKRGVKIHKI